MYRETTYEWDVETWDEHDDVQDHCHWDTLRDALRWVLMHSEEERKQFQLVLVRDVWCENEGLVDREWAYVQESTLPKHFRDAANRAGHTVPIKYRLEFDACPDITAAIPMSQEAATC